MKLIITKCFPACLSPHHPVLERLHFESMGVKDILFHWHTRKCGISAAWGWSVLQNVRDVFISWIARLIKTTCKYLWVGHSIPGTVRSVMKCVSTFTWLEIDISLSVSSLGKHTRTDAIQIYSQLDNIHKLLVLKYDSAFEGNQQWMVGQVSDTAWAT